MVDRNRCHIDSLDAQLLSRVQFAKFDGWSAAIAQLNLLKVRPHIVIKDVFSQRGDYIGAAVNDDGIAQHIERFGDVYRQRSGVVGVRVGHDDVTDASNFTRAKSEADAAAVNRDAIVNNEGGQTLEL